MKVFKHKITGETLSFKKDYGTVVALFCEPYEFWPGCWHNVVVCAKENLIEITEEVQGELNFNQ